MCFITFSVLVFPTLHPTNNVFPTGGVIFPIQRLNTSIIPNCTVSIPKFCAIGSNIGVNIKIAGVKSINVPTTNNKIFIANNTNTLLLEIPKINSVIIVGILVKARTHDIIDEAAIKNNNLAAIFAHNQILEIIYQGGLILYVLYSYLMLIIYKKFKEYKDNNVIKIFSIYFLALFIMMLTEVYNNPTIFMMYMI